MTGPTAGSTASPTESRCAPLKPAQLLRFQLKRATWFGLWSRRSGVRVPSLTPDGPAITFFCEAVERRGVNGGDNFAAIVRIPAVAQGAGMLEGQLEMDLRTGVPYEPAKSST
jgi:hypothetical protein